MRTNVLGVLLVTPTLIFGSMALAEHFIEPFDTISLRPNYCTVTGYDPEDVYFENLISVTATGGVAIVKQDPRRGWITGKCQITGLTDEITFYGNENPTVGFPCVVSVGGKNIELDPDDPDVTTKKRITKKGTVSLDCSGPGYLE